MEISATNALNLYKYQSSLQSTGQASAVFQALTQVYSQATAKDPSTLSTNDALASLAGQANLKPLITAIYNQAQALQGASSPTEQAIQGLSGGTQFAGVNATSASSLLSDLGSSASVGLQGFDSAIGGSPSLAAILASAQKAYGNGTLTSDSRTLATQETNGTNPASTTYALQAAATAQAAALNNTFTLLA